MSSIDPHPAAIITQSATVHGNTVYVGVASFEELFAAAVPGYTLSFRGSMAAIWRSVTPKRTLSHSSASGQLSPSRRRSPGSWSNGITSEVACSHG